MPKLRIAVTYAYIGSGRSAGGSEGGEARLGGGQSQPLMMIIAHPDERKKINFREHFCMVSLYVSEYRIKRLLNFLRLSSLPN